MRTHIDRDSARRVAVVASALCLAVGAMAAPVNASEALTPIQPIKLGAAPNGYTMNRPDVLLTSKGTTLIAWREYQKDPNRIRLVRKTKRDNGFERVAVPPGVLTEFGEPYLTEDPVSDRIILSASAQSADLATLGLYVWTSRNHGASWSQPTRVWDRFATGQIALDGEGGFYAITDQTGVSVTHVPPTLDAQVWPNDDIILSDRISSRGAVGVATTGPASDLLFAFADSGHRGFVHVALEPGLGNDGVVMSDLAGDGDVKIVADRKAALVAGLTEIERQGQVTWWLRASTLTMSASHEATSTPMHPIAPKNEDVSWFTINTVPGRNGRATGRFEAVWITHDGHLRTAHTTEPGIDGAGSWSQPQTLLTFPSRGGYQFPGPLANDGPWVAVHAYNRNRIEVQIAVAN